MAKKKQEERRLVAIPQEVDDFLIQLSQRYALPKQQILKRLLYSLMDNFRYVDSLEILDIFYVIPKLNFLGVPMSLHEGTQGDAEKTWKIYGENLARLLNGSKDPEKVTSMIRGLIRLMLPVKAGSEVKEEVSGNGITSVRVMVTAPSKDPELKLLYRILEGFMEELNYEIQNGEVSAGLLEVRFVKHASKEAHDDKG